MTEGGERERERAKERETRERERERGREREIVLIPIVHSQCNTRFCSLAVSYLHGYTDETDF